MVLWCTPAASAKPRMLTGRPSPVRRISVRRTSASASAYLVSLNTVTSCVALFISMNRPLHETRLFVYLDEHRRCDPAAEMAPTGQLSAPRVAVRVYLHRQSVGGTVRAGVAELEKGTCVPPGEIDTELYRSGRMNTMVDSQSRTDLADLVRTRRGELKLSLRALADLCVDPADPGEPLWKFGVLHRLEKGLPILRPGGPELRALAAGLRLPADDVKTAADSQFHDIPNDATAPRPSSIDTVWSEDRKTRAMVRDYESMTPEDQERVRQLMRAWSKRPASDINGE